MSSKAITFNSPDLYVNTQWKQLNNSNTEGLKCECSGNVMHTTYQKITMTFKLDRSALQYSDELTGQIIAKSRNQPIRFPPTAIDVEMTEMVQEFKMTITTSTSNSEYNFSFEYSLTPHNTPVKHVSYEEMFAPSEKHDVILVVENKKLHVNKAFLSYHSEFFDTLFSKKFKEGQMTEIPIEKVSYDDFGLLLSSFYPNPEFPTDKTVEKLLELASRFMLTSVIGIIEYHLMHNTRIGNEKMIWMADKYVMPKLLEKCIRQLSTIEQAKALNASNEYKELSDPTKAKLLDRLMKLIQLC